MIKKNNFFLILPVNILFLVISIYLYFFTAINPSHALSHDWIGVPESQYGKQLWDKKSIKRNEDGSVRILSKFIPKTKSEITQDIFYTMDINCFEKSFRDVDVSIDPLQKNLNNFAEWKDPSGDQLVLGVISQVCRFED